MNLITRLLNVVQYDHATETYSGHMDLDTCLREASPEYSKLPFPERMEMMLHVNRLVKDAYFDRPMDTVKVVDQTKPVAKNIEYFYFTVDSLTFTARVTDDFDEFVTNINIRDLLTVTRNGTPLDHLIKKVLVSKGIASTDDVVTMVERSNDESGSN